MQKAECRSESRLLPSTTQDIQQPELTQPKDTFVASIMPVKLIALAMMDTGSRQMTNPPHGHEQGQQEPIEALPIGDEAGFQIPAATYRAAH